MTITVSNLQPIIAILAGILILIAPRLLNYIVAVYLIVVGLIGLGVLRHFPEPTRLRRSAIRSAAHACAGAPSCDAGRFVPDSARTSSLPAAGRREANPCTAT